MKKHTLPLACEAFYHVYNRGINGCDIFFESRNYPYFLRQYAKYIPQVADTYAYCLLKNHFHILIKTKSVQEIIYNPNIGKIDLPSDGPGKVVLESQLASKLISRQFSKLFNSYSQAINKGYGRTGGLFEEPFRRIHVDSDSYFLQLVYYIHANPMLHKFVEDFREYPYSSYHSHISKLNTNLKRMELISWFNGMEGYQKYHLSHQILNDLSKFKIELD